MTRRIPKDATRTPVKVAMLCKPCKNTWGEEFFIPMTPKSLEWRLRFLECSKCGSKYHQHEASGITERFFQLEDVS
jgi:hypothetical protein